MIKQFLLILISIFFAYTLSSFIIPIIIKNDKREYAYDQTARIPSFEITRALDNQLLLPLSKVEGLEIFEFVPTKGESILQVNYDFVKYDIENTNGNIVSLSRYPVHLLKVPSSRTFIGELSQVQGSMKGHMCSFKYDVDTRKVYVRASVLEEWELATTFLKQFTKGDPIRTWKF